MDLLQNRKQKSRFFSNGPQNNKYNMLKKMRLPIFLLLSFSAGFMANSIWANNAEEILTKKVTGIGGVFFKCKNPTQMRTWYHENLGLATNAYGAVFEWHQGADSTQKGFTQWSPFKETTTYFGKAEQQVMINYRVENLALLVKDLQKKQVKIVDTLSTYSYGKFIHIEDLEGNRIELWEPNDKEYEKLGIDMGTKTTK